MELIIEFFSQEVGDDHIRKGFDELLESVP